MDHCLNLSGLFHLGGIRAHKVEAVSVKEAIRLCISAADTRIGTIEIEVSTLAVKN